MPAPARSVPPTRCEGFINNLDASAPGWDKADDALVLGAGGSARAVVFGLVERGIKRVHLVNRTTERARALAGQFGASVLPAAWEAIDELLPRAGRLSNTPIDAVRKPSPNVSA